MTNSNIGYNPNLIPASNSVAMGAMLERNKDFDDRAIIRASDAVDKIADILMAKKLTYNQAVQILELVKADLLYGRPLASTVQYTQNQTAEGKQQN